ncbi:copper resistance protein B [Sphingobium limneticum]|jgi:copper resistance protein B|uniref:Copper resistance protein B n=1 Tax=Sphingobium xenophagum TaxID=121428 RepID=A0A401J556_SPHXE|nr:MULTISPECIES: copper resistance protein B [Sphingobium]KAA9013923.1 copper resistance protein B [Sphingobium limneticum]GBH31728.1 copper resistance protein B [Sphingobium xenophagum]
MQLKLLLIAGGAALGLATPAAAQMDHSNMPGMKMPPPKTPAVKKPVTKKPAATKPGARKKSVKPAARSTPRAKAGSGAKPAAGRSAKPPAPGTVVADPHAGHNMTTMPGMATPGSNPNPGARHDMSAMPDTSGGAAPGQPSAMPGMDHGSMPGMDQGSGAMQGMAGHDMESMPPSTTGMAMVGTNLPAGDAPPPPIPTDRAADQVYSAAAMAHSQQHLQMHGGQNFSQVIFNLAEYQVRDGRDAYRWDGGAWYGGDINRLVLKTEGEGNFGRSLERAELQALYARAIGPFTDFQAGIRYDFKPNPSRVYATVGFESLAPGFFDVEGALFLSSKGDVLGRVEGYYDQRITQRLILQPRLEAEFAAQDVPEDRIGSGLSDLELGLRLRYEVKREFAPYIGVSYERRVGRSARFAREDGEDASSTSLVLGIRTWF